MMSKRTKDLVKVIEQISDTINLTLYGKSQLSIFPISALHYAHQQLINALKKGITIKSPFGFVYHNAEQYCKNAGMTINYEAFDKLQEKYNFTTEDKPTTGTISFKPSFKEEQPERYTPKIKIYKHKKGNQYDANHEAEGYNKIESSTQFQQTSSIFGDFFNKCKQNILAKAS
jgi:hypothetical protein